uniref:ATP-dependent DNA helicase n=1 Tax=Panagrellus redivivus TaxID=6233 RepID=A0A7E4ZPW9_PANRE
MSTGPKLQNELEDVKNELTKVSEEIRRLQNRKNDLLAKRRQIENRIADRNAQMSDDQSVWETDNFPWSSEAVAVLNETFKLNTFRPLQKSVINAVMSGEDTIIIMSTGGGKSLCYQLPAVLAKGLTLVVSPLISLIQDQLIQLKKLGIEAATINQGTSAQEVTRIQNAMIDPKSSLRLIYVTPEKLAKSKRFMSKLEKSAELKCLKLIAIDEVHCCSQWGHDFRPDYKFLHMLKKQLKGVPVLGLTATATGNVLADVKAILGVETAIVFKAGFNRENLYYEVRPKPASNDAVLEDLLELLKGRFKGQTGIVYCFSRKECEELAGELRQNGVTAGAYHAYLEPEVRERCHERWLSGKVRVIVATVAFGMGIDKPDVRFVIHHSLSKSMETYYQESGRAGRDGQPATCILYYRFADVFRVSTMVCTEKVGTQNLYSVVSYATMTSGCRRVAIADHFDETWDESWCNKMCDNCRSGKKASSTVDPLKFLPTAKEIIQSQTTNTKNNSGRVTAPKLAELVHKKLSKTDSRESVEYALARLILDGYLAEDFHFTPYAIIGYVVAGSRRQMPDLSDSSHKRKDNDSIASSSASTPSKKAKTVKEDVIHLD